MTDFCAVPECQGDAQFDGFCFSHAYEQGILPKEVRIQPLIRQIAQQNGQVARQPVTYRYEGLNWDFIKAMAEIANYAGEKYGSPEQYTNGRLEGDKSPLNHIPEHYRAYLANEVHDHFKTRSHQLAAIAYNAMMEFYYLHHGGPTVPDVFYTRGAE